MTSIYYCKNGLRLVKEYEHKFVTFTKKRWLNQPLLDIYTKEFHAHTKQYYEAAIKSGKITVNNETVPLTYRLKDNDRIVHTLVRKEIPVFDSPIDILHETDDFIAVDKPASMPVHQTGSYFYNTLLGVLEHENCLKGLKCVNRLDKQTSGVVFLAKNDKSANEFRESL